MKKYFVYLFALTAIIMFTSCNDDENTVNKQTFASTINTRALDGDEMVFSQGTGNFELNYTDNTLQFSYEFKDAAGQAQTMTTPILNLTAVSSTVFSFSDVFSSTYSGVNGLQGYIDFSTGAMWYTFTLDSGATIISSTHLLYAYVTTSIDGGAYSHTQSAYLIIPDSKCETATMRVSNFIPDTNGSVQAATVEYNGLTITPTTTGYIVTSIEAESSYKGYFTLTDVNIVLDDQCKAVGGSFKCNGHTFNITGKMFN